MRLPQGSFAKACHRAVENEFLLRFLFLYSEVYLPKQITKIAASEWTYDAS